MNNFLCISGGITKVTFIFSRFYPANNFYDYWVGFATVVKSSQYLVNTYNNIFYPNIKSKYILWGLFTAMPSHHRFSDIFYTAQHLHFTALSIVHSSSRSYSWLF